MLLAALATGRTNAAISSAGESPHALLGSVSCTAGEVELAMEFAARPEYGLVYPLLAEVEGGVRVRVGASYMLLSSPVPLALEESIGRARRSLKAGQRASLALQYRASWSPTAG